MFNKTRGELRMEKVLLAIDGITPDKQAFDHAVALCLRIKAELKILQVIRPQKITSCLKKMKNTAHQAKRFFEDSMMAATFAEAGEFETADILMSEALKNINKLLPESKKAGVPCHLTMKSGEPMEAIVQYVRENRDVVVAVYDRADGGDLKTEGRPKNNPLQTSLRALPIPVVMLRNNNDK